jgi:ankyrin repeat protein
VLIFGVARTTRQRSSEVVALVGVDVTGMDNAMVQSTRNNLLLKWLPAITLTAIALAVAGYLTSRPQDNLFSAAQLGKLQVVEEFLATGVSVNAQDDLGTTDLHHAIAGQQIEVVRLLLAKGANMNAKDSDGVTPFFQAGQSGQNEIVQLLIARGARCKWQSGRSGFDATSLGGSVRPRGGVRASLGQRRGRECEVQQRRNTPSCGSVSWGCRG